MFFPILRLCVSSISPPHGKVTLGVNTHREMPDKWVSCFKWQIVWGTLPLGLPRQLYIGIISIISASNSVSIDRGNLIATMLWAFPDCSDIICDLKSNQDRVILIQGRCLSCHSLIWIPRLHTFCFIAIWFPRLTINYRISGNQLSVSFVYWQKEFANASRIHCCRVSYLSRSLPWER